MIRNHLQYLERRMTERRMGARLNYSKMFEYYAAIHLTKLHEMPFYVYEDMPPAIKKEAGFPPIDMGIDLINDRFNHIAQVKFYKEGSRITYSGLSTFLATPVLVGRPHLQLSLVRTEGSRIHPYVQQIIRRRGMNDIPLEISAFLDRVRRL